MKDNHNEVAYIRQMLKMFKKVDIVAIVSDTYDIYNFVDILGHMKDEIKGATKGGKTLVVRPDSGDPVETPIWVIKKLGEKFGYTTNSKGYKVLDPSVRVIQGDGINPTSIRQILKKLKNDGWSAENIAFGMGGALLQKVDRDTLNFAMKTNAMEFEDQGWKDVFKQPVGSAMKKSKPGILALVERDGEIQTVRESDIQQNETNLLRKVWECGNLLHDDDFEQIRERGEIK